MQKAPLYFTGTKAPTTTDPVAIPTADLQRHAQDWLFDSECRNHSRSTIDGKKDVAKKLIWFLGERQYTSCGTSELRHFLAYIATGHKEPGGRWGNPLMTKPVRPRTIKYYYVYLQGLFRWLVAEEALPISPLDRIAPPVARSEQVQAFTPSQIEALLEAAKRTVHPRRDEAIVLFLLDSGVRASELCALRLKDLDLSGRRCVVLGKGNKHRTVYIGRATSKALWLYLREKTRSADDPVFLSDRGGRTGTSLTRSGLLQLIERLGQAADLQLVRCSPHTFRHTFAIEYLRNGANLFSLQQVLGHTTLAMTSRYVALAESDVANQHRAYSPVDRLKSRSE